MKKAFTLLELVFVIVIIGILATQFFKTSDNNNLQLAANQVISHIRYTQHLAMMDDKFDANESSWFKGRWQIRFSNTEGSDNKWSYSIYSDFDFGSGYDGNPNASEIAANPLDKLKKLTGGYTSTIEYDDIDSSKNLNVGKKFNIQDVDFTGGCEIYYKRQRISFDYLGRPFYGAPNSLTEPYKDNSYIKLLREPCYIRLCEESCIGENDEFVDGEIVIHIEPETGYAHL